MTRFVVIVLVAIGILVSGRAYAEEGKPWEIRARAVWLGMEDNSEAGIGAAVGLLPGDAIHVSDKVIPEVDISYYFARNWAAELVLTIPQKHRVEITNGPLRESVGTFRHLPPTLMLQYHFRPDAKFRPYVGLGLNYTLISSVRLRSNVAGANLDLEDNSFGPAFQAGFDVPLAFMGSENTYFNFDVKKIQIRSDVTMNGSKISSVELDPWAIGAGLGWRF